MSEGFGPQKVFEVFGMPITDTVTVTWLIMAIVITVSYFATRNLKKRASGAQIITELVVDSVNKLTEQTMGVKLKAFSPYIGTILIFLGIANIAGLFGVRPPTADVNTTISLAIVTFLMIHFFGLKYNGLSYIKGFAEPFALLLPLNIMGELATPISLGFRLFGNIVGGMIIMNLLYGALASFTPSFIGIPLLQAGIPVVLHIYFDLFAGVLQSFIFAMLTMVFISIAVD